MPIQVPFPYVSQRFLQTYQKIQVITPQLGHSVSPSAFRPVTRFFTLARPATRSCSRRSSLLKMEKKLQWLTLADHLPVAPIDNTLALYPLPSTLTSCLYRDSSILSLIIALLPPHPKFCLPLASSFPPSSPLFIFLLTRTIVFVIPFLITYPIIHVFSLRRGRTLNQPGSAGTSIPALED